MSMPGTQASPMRAIHPTRAASAVSRPARPRGRSADSWSMRVARRSTAQAPVPQVPAAGPARSPTDASASLTPVTSLGLSAEGSQTIAVFHATATPRPEAAVDRKTAAATIDVSAFRDLAGNSVPSAAPSTTAAVGRSTAVAAAAPNDVEWGEPTSVGAPRARWTPGGVFSERPATFASPPESTGQASGMVSSSIRREPAAGSPPAPIASTRTVYGYTTPGSPYPAMPPSWASTSSPTSRETAENQLFERIIFSWGTEPTPAT